MLKLDYVHPVMRILRNHAMVSLHPKHDEDGLKLWFTNLPYHESYINSHEHHC